MSKKLINAMFAISAILIIIAILKCTDIVTTGHYELTPVEGDIVKLVPVTLSLQDFDWNANTEPDLKGYYIYYSRNGAPFKSATVGKDTTFQVNLWSGQYRVYLKAVDYSGNVSEPSDTLHVGV